MIEKWLKKDSAYKEAGVDTLAASQLVSGIKPLIERTKRSGVMGGIGGFGAMFDLKATGYKDPLLVSCTDGVGTKIKIAIELDRHDTIGIDAVAMCVNDAIVQGAEPLYFLDYFACGKLVNEVAEKVIAGVAEGCEQAGCALIGGETAEMPGLYVLGDYDLAGFCVAAVERKQLITGEQIKPGDVLLGLSSNGLHSNGFSLVRNLIKKTQGLDYKDYLSFDETMSLGELLLTPTRIYVRSILNALKIKDGRKGPAIKGMAHITGGGLIENIPRMLPAGTRAVVDLQTYRIPRIYPWLADIGHLKSDDITQTFNCGLGFVIACRPEHKDKLSETLHAQGESVFEIGRIEARAGDDEPPIVIHNAETLLQY